MANLFKNAKATAGSKPAKAKKSTKDEVTITDLNTLASIETVIKSLTSLKETVEASVKEQMKQHFIEAGVARQKRPENFRGIDGAASASCELKKRSSRSTLTDDEVEVLDKFGVSYETVNDVEERFIVNPAYQDNQDLLGTVSKALEKVKGLPEDFIMMQPAVSRKVVSDEALNELFRVEKKHINNILPMVAVLAVKPKLDNTDVADAMETLKNLIGE